MRRASTVPTVATAPPGILADVTCGTGVVFAVVGDVVMSVVTIAVEALSFRDDQRRVAKNVYR